MKTMNLFLTLVALSAFFLTPAAAQKHIADGSHMNRRNRLISTKSEPGKQLYLQKKTPDKITLELDGKTDEDDWNHAQVITSFVDKSGQKDPTTVRVLFDDDNIYLFWAVHEQAGITAEAKEADALITGDDYVQINLKPWLVDSIKYGRDYYYSIAVNPAGAVWDSYFDPYLDGYFFSSWNSNIQVVTSKKDNDWFAEMIIPFSGLDNYSDPSWKWNLDFLHADKINKTEPPKLYAPKLGVTVQQGIMVRDDGLVNYYWIRSEFMQEVKPEKRSDQDNSVSAAAIDNVPAVNSKPDTDLWSDVELVEINYNDRIGEKLNENTARAKVALAADYICFSLEADGAKIDRLSEAEKLTGQGMAAQMAGVNGVYVDTSLFANECFWILLQPRRPDADHIHLPHYLITVNNHGQIDATSYDRFGAPDRSWQPKAQLDIYNTDTGWAAEVAIDLSSFDLPPKCDKTWGFNVFRNRILENSDKKSQLQAWLYTATDFLNPDTMGTLTDIRIEGLDTLRPGFERKVTNMREKIAAHAPKHKKITAKLYRQLDKIKLGKTKQLFAAEQTLQQIDNTLGVLDAKEHYDAFAHPTKGGYPLFDVQFIGRKGWAVGAMGTVLRTENGGKTWQSVDIKSDADFHRVFFVDKLTGWAAGGTIRMATANELMRHDERGGYGYIFHTRDGGKTWSCQYGRRGRHLFGLHFTNKKTGFACGERGFLLKTEDGGISWNQLPTTATRRWLYGITFKDKLNGFAVGESEAVIKTNDGGKSWVKVNAPADRKFYQFRPFYRDISFNGSTGCIIGHNGSILISNDAGKTWRPTATFFDTQIREFLDLTRVRFVTEKLGYAVGELGSRIMVTEDAGASWSLRPVANRDWLRALWADDTGKLVLVGEREKILISNDKGYNWNTLRGDPPKADILLMLAHGDDSPIALGSFLVHNAINQEKLLVDIGVLRDCHSSEYEETYNMEHDRDVWMSGVRTSTNFDEFETGNNGCDYYHFNQRLWEGQENVVRHMVAAIRAYQPDIVIVHGGVYGDYDKPGHKVTGRAGIPAFETSGGQADQWPQLTKLGLEPWQAKKLYCLASESYPATLDLTPISKLPLKGTDGTCWDWADYVIRNFKSQGVHHTRNSKLCLIKSLVPVPEKELSVFDGLE
jgi:photosystem II stability/assembly factor-like uncharacterized protein